MNVAARFACKMAEFAHLPLNKWFVCKKYAGSSVLFHQEFPASLNI